MLLLDTQVAFKLLLHSYPLRCLLIFGKDFLAIQET